MKAQILKALSHTTRLKILEFIKGREKSIHEILSTIHGGQSNISQHISLMQKYHIVTTRKDGVRLVVKVKDPEVFTILDLASKILRDRFKEQKKLLSKL